LPSRFEGLPLVALEAPHYGLPVIASTHAGLNDFLPPSCLFDFGDEHAMWAALKEHRNSRKRAAALAFSRARIRRLLCPASFRAGVHRTVAALSELQE